MAKKPLREVTVDILFWGAWVFLFVVFTYKVYVEPYATRGTTEQRIERLTKSLSESVELITEIQREIEKRSALASKLQSDIATYDQAVKLKQPEVEAVAQLLRGEIEQERKYALLQDVSLQSCFFVLGILADRLFERLRRRRELQREKTQEVLPTP